MLGPHRHVTTQGMERKGWSVVITQTGREEIVSQNLAALGYEVDFLWYRRVLADRRVRIDGMRKRAPKTIVRRPLFPRYGFVLVPYDIDTSDIDRAIGVIRLLRHLPVDGLTGRPKIVRARVVEQLRAAIAAGEFDDPELRSTPPRLKEGMRVRAPNSGMVVTIRSLDERGRIEYISELLGGVPGRFNAEDAALLEVVE